MIYAVTSPLFQSFLKAGKGGDGSSQGPNVASANGKIAGGGKKAGGITATCA